MPVPGACLSWYYWYLASSPSGGQDWTMGTMTTTSAATNGAATADRAAAGSHSRRAELAAFLRSRRERITPVEAGLPPGLRRRTPGLRREEVAQLAGVGVTWYTWLEQGRPINASVQVLAAVART